MQRLLLMWWLKSGGVFAWRVCGIAQSAVWDTTCGLGCVMCRGLVLHPVWFRREHSLG